MFPFSFLGVAPALVYSMVCLVSAIWYNAVNKTVPEPYLDEVFHIPQAQAYCRGRFDEWDPMITTPPGLYLLALPLRRLGVRLFSARAAAASGVEGDCGVTNLRGANLIGLLAIAVLAGMCRALLERRNATAGSSAVQQPPTGAGGAPDGRMRMEVLPVGLAHLVYGLLGKNEHAALANVGVATGIIAVGPTGTQPRRGRLGDVTDWPWMTLDALLTGALAVALFPPLFFFSALFYTDVLSTLVVLAAFYVHLLRLSGPAKVPVWRRTVLDAAVVVLGIAALLMRQTNVFWIVVFMGGREAVDAVLSVAAQSRINPASMVDIVWATKPFQFYLKEWWIGHVHDPPLSLAWPDDFLFMALSMAVAMLGNVPRVLARVWPYIVVLLTFVRFVIWNGGVVLGDKSNHVATIHLAQMLYIWPFFAFFSAPLFVPEAVHIWKRVTLRFRPETPQQRPGNEPAGAKAAQSTLRTRMKRAIASLVYGKSRYVPLLAVSALAAALLIVHYNTIVHPFLLADNRHYMFYVFRYLIRPSAILRHGLVVPYAVSFWFVWSTLRGCVTPSYDQGWSLYCPGATVISERTDAGTWLHLCSPLVSSGDVRKIWFGGLPTSLGLEQRPNDSSPSSSEQVVTTGGQQPTQGEARRRHVGSRTRDEDTEPQPDGSTTQTAAGSTATPRPTSQVATPQSYQGQQQIGPQPRRQFARLGGRFATSHIPPATSTVALWLLTTTLSLCTAPLVEPRYFILPWIFFRLLVPSWSAHICPISPAEAVRKAIIATRDAVARRRREFSDTRRAALVAARDAAERSDATNQAQEAAAALTDFDEPRAALRDLDKSSAEPTRQMINGEGLDRGNCQRSTGGDGGGGPGVGDSGGMRAALLTWSKTLLSAAAYDVVDIRLVLEALWFLAVNAVVGWVFLYRPYVWRDQQGEVLDDGRLQRFMW